MCDCSIVFPEKDGAARSDNKIRTIAMAKSLDELLRLKGVIAAGEFGPNGKLLDFRSKGALLPDDEALLMDQFADAVSQLLFALPPIHSRISGILGVLAVGHGRMSGVNLVPEQGWIYSAGDITIAVGRGRGVFTKTAESDFNHLFTALASDSTQGLCVDSSDHPPSNLTPLVIRAC
jgi:roadblock/LC7 domain-containing protein